MGLGAGVSFARGGQMMGWQSSLSSGDSIWLPSGYLRSFPDLRGCSEYFQRKSIQIFIQLTIRLQKQSDNRSRNVYIYLTKKSQIPSLSPYLMPLAVRALSRVYSVIIISISISHLQIPYRKSSRILQVVRVSPQGQIFPTHGSGPLK